MFRSTTIIRELTFVGQHLNHCATAVSVREVNVLNLSWGTQTILIGGLAFLFFLQAGVTMGTALAQWLRCCATNRKVAVSIPDGVIGIFHWHNPSDRPGVDSASNRNEYQEYFLGVKSGRRVRLTTLTTILCRCHDI